MAGLNIQEESLYLPEDAVRKSPGFTVDVGKYARIHALILTRTHTVDEGNAAPIHSLTLTHTHTEDVVKVAHPFTMCVSVRPSVCVTKYFMHFYRMQMVFRTR